MVVDNFRKSEAKLIEIPKRLPRKPAIASAATAKPRQVGRHAAQKIPANAQRAHRQSVVRLCDGAKK